MLSAWDEACKDGRGLAPDGPDGLAAHQVTVGPMHGWAGEQVRVLAQVKGPGGVGAQDRKSIEEQAASSCTLPSVALV
jgi:hypothetical protein